MKNYISELTLEKGKAFLNLLPQIKSYSEIIGIRNFFQSFFERIVETNCNKLSDLEKLVEYEKISLEGEKMKIFKGRIFENIDIIKKRIIEKYIAMSQYYLVDFNWNVNVFKYLFCKNQHYKVSVSSNNLAKIQVPFLILELILKKNGLDSEMRVKIEMNKEELIDFLEVLHKMEEQIEY